ncbi:MAG: cellulose synthase/poly-beta-1,6-N-acetylglucosamine synthase-like glycosyltransferase [Kiritimatiellia bacterium]|jgi:cellulose synthase/poly-beta-1,6-N-acetylglucosamine synthase-like glycosyltransferase
MLYFLSTTYSVLVLPPLIYLLLISLAGLKSRKLKMTYTPATGTIGILIPAHNEKQTIRRTIDNLLKAAEKDNDIEINVIADNCSDNTAEIAQQTSVNVMQRKHKHLRGKGAALQWAMKELADKDYDYTLIIDADSIVNEHFFNALRITLGEPNCEVVQSRYEALANEHSSIKRLAMLGFNVLRARGRVAIGGSAGIMGNGFIVSKAALKKVPFRANSIVEDLEYHMRLVESDVKVSFCDAARIYGEMPSNDAASDIQSSRWEGGRLGVLKAAWWPLFKKSCAEIFKKEYHALDALLDLMLLPIGYMVLILLIGLLFPYTQITAIFGFFVIVIYVLGAATCGDGLKELSVLKKLPIFLLKKMGRIPALIASSSTKTQWQRTPRDKE